MHSAQQVIKTFAIALAIVIIGAIVTAVFAALTIVGDVVGLWNKSEETTMLENKYDYISSAITDLRVDVKAARLMIVRGDEFAVESNSEYVSYSQRGNSLKVEERNHNIFAGGVDTEVTIYVPERMKLEYLEVDGGAGSVYIDGIEAQTAKFDLGAGKTELHGLTVQQETTISCGAGLTEIVDSWLYNLDLDAGAGKVMLDGRLFGKAKIDAGVGALEINLLGSADDYYVSVNRGIGSVKINGEDRSGDAITYGSGPQQVYIDGGVGSIKVEVRGE